jgi:hypothetical protein
MPHSCVWEILHSPVWGCHIPMFGRMPHCRVRAMPHFPVWGNVTFYVRGMSHSCV